jgi:hypothetical protein
MNHPTTFCQGFKRRLLDFEKTGKESFQGVATSVSPSRVAVGTNEHARLLDLLRIICFHKINHVKPLDGCKAILPPGRSGSGFSFCCTRLQLAF